MNQEAPTTIADLRKKHPFPWNHMMYGNGRLVVADANNVEIPLLVMVNFLAMITNVMNQPEQKA